MNILVIAPAWIGDMVMSHCLLQCLVERYPSCQIHLVAGTTTAPLAQRMAEVSQVHVAPFGRGELALRRRWRMARQLSRWDFDLALVLPNSWKSALIPWWAGIAQRRGWHGEARYMLLSERLRLQSERYPLMIERFMALADPHGGLPSPPYPVPHLQADAKQAQSLGLRFDLDLSKQVYALCPGAEFGPAKQWPAASYAELASRLIDNGAEVWLFGSPADRTICGDIQQQLSAAQRGHLIDLSGRTSLLEALDLLSLARQAFCNDSGLMHVAAALGVPTVGVFGSTSPAFTPPLGDHTQVAQIDLPCRPCFARQCPLDHLNCLNQLPVDQVWEMVH